MHTLLETLKKTCPKPLASVELPGMYLDNSEMAKRREILRRNYDMSEEQWALLHESADKNHKEFSEAAKNNRVTSHSVQVIAEHWGRIALKLAKATGRIPAVSNLADANHFLGLAWSGGNAQEEEMAYITTSMFYVREGELEESSSKGLYPYTKKMVDLINGENDEVYFDAANPRLCFRGRESDKHDDTGFEELPLTEVVKFFEIRGAAQVVTPNSPFNEALARKKIHAQLATLKKHGIKDAILMPSGCGVFNNPREVIARLYQEVLSTEEFQDVFENIVFAVDQPRTAMVETFHRALYGIPLSKSAREPLSPPKLLENLARSASWLSLQEENTLILIVDFTDLSAGHLLGGHIRRQAFQTDINEHPIALDADGIVALNAFIKEKGGEILLCQNMAMEVKAANGFPYLEISMEADSTSADFSAALRGRLKAVFSQLLDNSTYEPPLLSFDSDQKNRNGALGIQAILTQTEDIGIPVDLKKIFIAALFKRSGEFPNPDWVSLSKRLFDKVVRELGEGFGEAMNTFVLLQSALNGEVWLTNYKIEEKITALVQKNKVSEKFQVFAKPQQTNLPDKVIQAVQIALDKYAKENEALTSNELELCKQAIFDQLATNASVKNQGLIGFCTQASLVTLLGINDEIQRYFNKQPEQRNAEAGATASSASAAESTSATTLYGEYFAGEKKRFFFPSNGNTTREDDLQQNVSDPGTPYYRKRN